MRFIEMRRKSVLPIYVFVILCVPLSTNLLDIYKKGVVKLSPDLEYGKNTDWSNLLYDQISSFIIARDGSLFITTPRQDKVFKFDSNGNFLKSFGQKGQGPGDLQEPRSLSILDDKYLVIREISSTGRISLFDLNGQFVTILQAGRSVLDCVSLQNNRIAFLTWSTSQEKDNLIANYIVFIRDISSGDEIKVDEFHLIYKREAQFIRGNYGSLYGSVFLGRSDIGDKLLVGCSSDPKLSIYGTDGKLIRSFLLTNMNLIKIDGAMKNLFFKEAEERINRQIRFRAQSLELLKKARQDDVLPEYVPYYRDIVIDPEGHILVFKFFLFEKNNKYLFQVYSPEGHFICETKIDAGDYEPIGQALLHQSYGYGPFQKKGDDASFYFFRMKLQ